MRIRRLANVSAILAEASPTIQLQPLICHLNQSPWDVLTTTTLPSTLQLPPSPPHSAPSNLHVNRGNEVSKVKESFVLPIPSVKGGEQENVKKSDVGVIIKLDSLERKSSHIHDDEDGKEDKELYSKRKRARKSLKPRSLTSLIAMRGEQEKVEKSDVGDSSERKSILIDDDEAGKEDKRLNSKRKRARKSLKPRSLKSLIAMRYKAT